MNHQTSNIFKENPLNYNDIDLFLDLYGGMIVNSKFFMREDLLPAYLTKNNTERLDVIHSLVKKFHLLMNNMNEIGVSIVKEGIF